MAQDSNNAGLAGEEVGDKHWVDRLAAVMERVVPDAITTSIFLLVVLVVIALLIGTPLTLLGDPMRLQSRLASCRTQ